MPKIDRTLSRQLLWAFLIVSLWIVSIVLLGWWAASEIDGRSNARQMDHARAALDELLERLPKEQDSSAIWDDAVVAVRDNDGPWMSENLVEWMGEFYGHDRIYILTPDDLPLRTAVDGHLADNAVFDDDTAAILPIVERLRTAMATASEGDLDSTESVAGLGESDFVEFPNGDFGIVSIRPIIPETEAVAQAPGDEFLHVSVELMDSALLKGIGDKFGLDGLAISGAESPGAASLAVTDRFGQVVAWLVWRAEKPAAQLVARTAPMLLLAISFGCVCFGILLWRLRRTSKHLLFSEAQARYLAFHDQLTGIPNRALFEDRLERALANSRRSRTSTALHYLDLDGFKNVNDSLGHHAGDELVRQVAQRLAGAIREVDTVARIGGDEFAVVQVDTVSQNDVTALSQSLLGLFEQPFIIDGEQVSIGASIGAAIQATPHSSALDLMRQADIALYEAKSEGKARFCLFAGAMDEVVKRRRAIEKDLRLALDRGDGLALVYQPIYETSSRRLLGAEALARWNHPVHGALPPDLFIAIAEERGLIDKLGTWALKQASAFAVAHDLAWIAVNVSPVQLRDAYFPRKVALILRETGLEPSRLQLEVTEGVLLQNSHIVQSVIRELRSTGVSIALDDFGTGYSSITYLRSYGVDKLKIDCSFVAKLGQDKEIDSIVKAIVDLAKAMGMTVTAEGVETRHQLDTLSEMGCSEVQGYYLSRPEAPVNMAALLEAVQKRKTA